MSTQIHDLMKPSNDLPRCGDEFFKDGKYVCLLAGGSALLIDRFVKEVSEYSGQPMDWHYVGGRARVLTTGDTAKVWDAIAEMRLYILDTV